MFPVPFHVTEYDLWLPIEPLFNLLEVSDQSSALLFYWICGYLTIVLVPQTICSHYI
jgi:hypothetical protein